MAGDFAALRRSATGVGRSYANACRNRTATMYDANLSRLTIGIRGYQALAEPVRTATFRATGWLRYADDYSCLPRLHDLQTNAAG